MFKASPILDIQNASVAGSKRKRRKTPVPGIFII